MQSVCFHLFCTVISPREQPMKASEELTRNASSGRNLKQVSRRSDTTVNPGFTSSLLDPYVRTSYTTLSIASIVQRALKPWPLTCLVAWR